MSFDLVSTVMQQISPQMMAKMASALGMESGLATRAIGAIVPSLLGSFATAASTPAGATTLGQALASLGPDSLTQITNMIGTGEQASLIEDGTTMDIRIEPGALLVRVPGRRRS